MNLLVSRFSLFLSLSLRGVVYQWGGYEYRGLSTHYYPNDHGEHEASKGFSPEDKDSQEG